MYDIFEDVTFGALLAICAAIVSVAVLGILPVVL